MRNISLEQAKNGYVVNVYSMDGEGETMIFSTFEEALEFIKGVFSGYHEM